MRSYEKWSQSYDILKKCNLWAYESKLDKKELLEAVHSSDLVHQAALALHSAAEAYKCKFTNLNTLELYLFEPATRVKIEETLSLEPVKSGYQVLLVEPYYKSILDLSRRNKKNSLNVSPPILTYLDLASFPLRGIEQAEFMAIRMEKIKKIFDWKPKKKEKL